MNHDLLTNLQALNVINLWLSTFLYKVTELIAFHFSALLLCCRRFRNLCKLSRFCYFREPTGTQTPCIASMPPYLTELQILFPPPINLFLRSILSLFLPNIFEVSISYCTLCVE